MIDKIMLIKVVVVVIADEVEVFKNIFIQRRMTRLFRFIFTWLTDALV